MKLSALIIPSKTATIEYPGFPGFEVTLAYLTREELIKLRKKATTTKISRKTRQPEEEVDTDLFQQLYIEAVVKAWKGFKMKYVSKLLPIDASVIVNPDEELEFDIDNAQTLMKNSPEFDAWVSETLESVENFTKTS